MVHAVMGRRVRHPFQRAQRRYQFDVDEELTEQVDAERADHGERMKSDQGQRQEEQEIAGDVAGPSEPDRSREVQSGGRVMHRMGGSHPADTVRCAVLPVEKELRGQK